MKFRQSDPIKYGHIHGHKIKAMYRVYIIIFYRIIYKFIQLNFS